ncbi:hypothetical protein AAZX31_09G059700 [Glycine max]|uniref:Uncharacterized protein n=2 Tax=Glycine subgen. Soja TaxID=1462606 RepID=C6T4H6_SOYBN|nr:uncharacterized protein LOC100527492 [Glycine max]KHN35832.1 hypothetical protein glysoja_013257 [Glycine soja]ACU16586.1 unknown [Glycine max]KAH1041729.1 hypothetical protein GYH30_024205 [Glycine max]KAH1232152.1 hypothetical protein GmHk_09G024881 [Glycine max]KRH37368.1 hypothetical protein GLYMA_09G062000v4 [Glycine max]|eukprot:NP_001236809.1 uncharacterized protein LOC100527492 [Glycine max]
MGLEILEEFRPITPIRTVVPTVRTTLKHDLGTTTTTTKEVLNEDVVIEEECHTPTSPSQKLPTNPLVCPPAPKKPRVVPRRLKNLDPPSQEGFFQVPHDLASVFVLRSPSLPRRTAKQAFF